MQPAYAGNTGYIQARALPVCDLRCNIVAATALQVFAMAHLVPDAVILFYMEHTVLSSIWCDLVTNKIGIREGDEVQLQQ